MTPRLAKASNRTRTSAWPRPATFNGCGSRVNIQHKISAAVILLLPTCGLQLGSAPRSSSTDAERQLVPRTAEIKGVLKPQTRSRSAPAPASLSMCSVTPLRTASNNTGLSFSPTPFGSAPYDSNSSVKAGLSMRTDSISGGLPFGIRALGSAPAANNALAASVVCAWKTKKIGRKPSLPSTFGSMPDPSAAATLSARPDWRSETNAATSGSSKYCVAFSECASPPTRRNLTPNTRVLKKYSTFSIIIIQHQPIALLPLHIVPNK